MFLKRFGHVKIEQVLLVDHIATQIEANVHARLNLDAQTYANVW